MNILKFYVRTMKIMKIIEFHKKHENLRIPYENHEIHEIHIVTYDNHYKYKHPRIQLINMKIIKKSFEIENHENHKIFVRIMKSTKVLEFHNRFLKEMKIMKFHLRNIKNMQIIKLV